MVVQGCFADQERQTVLDYPVDLEMTLEAFLAACL